jgi:hypothetical protein
MLIGEASKSLEAAAVIMVLRMMGRNDMTLTPKNYNAASVFAPARNGLQLITQVIVRNLVCHGY